MHHFCKFSTCSRLNLLCSTYNQWAYYLQPNWGGGSYYFEIEGTVFTQSNLSGAVRQIGEQTEGNPQSSRGKTNVYVCTMLSGNPGLICQQRCGTVEFPLFLGPSFLLGANALARVNAHTCAIRAEPCTVTLTSPWHEEGSGTEACPGLEGMNQDHHKQN